MPAAALPDRQLQPCLIRQPELVSWPRPLHHDLMMTVTVRAWAGPHAASGQGRRLPVAWAAGQLATGPHGMSQSVTVNPSRQPATDPILAS